MNVDTVLVLILMVFNITSCQIFKMPKISSSQHLESTPYLNTKLGSCYIMSGMKWCASMKDKVVEGLALIKSSGKELKKVPKTKVREAIVILLSMFL